MTFADLRKGMSGKVVRITGNSDDVMRLQEMGLTVGTQFKVVKIAPFGDPIEIDLRGYRLCLRKHETREYEVELVQS